MSHNWPLSEAVHADSIGIASLFALSWTSPFSRLQFGQVDPLALGTAMVPRIAQQMKLPNILFVVIRNPNAGEVVAVAQWTLPSDDSATKETEEEEDERQILEDELYRKNLPEHSNKDLIMEFTTGLRTLRKRLLQGQKHYLLDNLATHPDHRGQGLASRLIEWAFPRADADDAFIYLETASDNPAAGLYRKLGFEERGHHTIEDLSKFVGREELKRCGGINEHTHIALIKGSSYNFNK
jgi:ribosomal protein S18 acetylase RimI-like enzyme